MTTQAQQNFLIKTLSRGCMASMREIVAEIEENGADRETVVRPLYTEMLRLAKKLSEKHDFAFHKWEKREKFVALARGFAGTDVVE